jgi:hypothetical protein
MIFICYLLKCYSEVIPSIGSCNITGEAGDNSVLPPCKASIAALDNQQLLASLRFSTYSIDK